MRYINRYIKSIYIYVCVFKWAELVRTLEHKLGWDVFPHAWVIWFGHGAQCVSEQRCAVYQRSRRIWGTIHWVETVGEFAVLLPILYQARYHGEVQRDDVQTCGLSAPKIAQQRRFAVHPARDKCFGHLPLRWAVRRRSPHDDSDLVQDVRVLTLNSWILLFINSLPWGSSGLMFQCFTLSHYHTHTRCGSWLQVDLMALCYVSGLEGIC